VKTHTNHSKKKSSKFTKNHTSRWYDDTQPYKISCPTQIRLRDIKITNFKRESWLQDLLEIYYFYISQTSSSLNNIFYKFMYYHIIYMCDFLENLDDFFTVVCMDFHEDYGFH